MSAIGNGFAHVMLRITLGLIFVAHGNFKLSWGMDQLAGWLGLQGFPLPDVLAPLLTSVELLGGLLLMIGVGTRYIAALFSIILLVAIFKVKLAIGFIAANATGYELDVILVVVSLFVALTGESRLDKAIRVRFRREVRE